MLPNKVARRKFSQWSHAKRILVYDTDSIVLPDNSNILGLLRKFRAEAGLSTDPQPSGVARSSGELQLSWLRGGFQAVHREQQALLDFSQVTDDDDDEDTTSPPPFPDSDYLGSAEHSVSTDPSNRPILLRTKHLPMSAFTASSTTSQRSGSTHHKLYHGHQAAARDLNPTSGPVPSSRTEFVSRPSVSGAATVTQSSTSDPGRSVAYNPFYDTIRQNVELSHGITERISLHISRSAKDRIDELPFMWLRELGRWAGAEEDLSDAEEDHIGGMSGSGSGSGMSGEDHSDSSSDSGDDSGSGREYMDGYVNPPAPAPAVFPANASTMMPEDPQAEGSEALAMQFYRIELGEQRRLMGIMAHHSRESGRVLEGETKSKSKKRSKLRSKGMGRSSRGKHGSREFPYSITAGVEKGAKNR